MPAGQAAATAVSEERYRSLGRADRQAERSHLLRNLKRFLLDNRLNLVGVCIVGLFIILSLFGEVLAPHDPYAQDIMGSKLRAPSLEHPLGTDELGRDVLSRVMTGTRISLQVAVVVLTFAVSFGTLIGALSGYLGGLADEVLMRITDMFLAFPALVLAVTIAATLGKNLTRACYGLCGRCFSGVAVTSQEQRRVRRRFEEEGGWVRAGHAETAHLQGAQGLGTLA